MEVVSIQFLHAAKRCKWLNHITKQGIRDESGVEAILTVCTNDVTQRKMVRTSIKIQKHCLTRTARKHQ
jgi:hypothetical protein